MVSNSFLKRFRKLDAYAKTLDDFRVRTATGGTGILNIMNNLFSNLTSKSNQSIFIVTLISTLTIAVLVLFEVVRYLTPVMQTEILVDGGIQVFKMIIIGNDRAKKD